MKALRWHARKDIRVEEIAEPVSGPDQVKVKVKWCGICGSDIHEVEAGPLLIATSKPHPLPGSKTAPVVMGHEFVGDIVEIGRQVTGFNIGDRVAVRPTMPCFRCHWCKKGNHMQCSTMGAIGSIWDGGFAEYMVAPGHCIYKIPDHLSYEAAVFAEPLACAVHAVKRANMSPGDSVAVVGAGPIGNLTMQVAKVCGAGSVFVIDMLSKRRELALELGATAVFNPYDVDAGKEIAKVTEGLRADIVFECAGPPAAMLTALNVGGKGGKIVEVGQMVGTCDFPFQRFWMHEKTIISAQAYTDEFPIALSFLSDKRIHVEPLITSKIKLDDIIEQGFKVLTGDQKNAHVKILVST